MAVCFCCWKLFSTIMRPTFVVKFLLLIGLNNLGAIHAAGCPKVKYGYEINYERVALHLGCFHSRGAHSPFPKNTLVDFTNQIDWPLWNRVGNAGDLIKKCGKLAIQKNVYNFGIKAHGECYFGDIPDESQGEVTTADGCDKCRWDVGGKDAVTIFNVAYNDYQPPPVTIIYPKP